MTLVHSGPRGVLLKSKAPYICAESELGALFFNCQNAIPIRTALTEMGHPQPPTPVQTDNSTAAGIANRTIKQRRSKAVDMRFYWLQDRIDDDQFRIFWKPGETNMGDYMTKHFPGRHHMIDDDGAVYIECPS